VKKMRIYINEHEIAALSAWEECPESLKQKLKTETCYLVEIVDTSRGTTRYEIYDRPQRTNMSNKIKISGWLGETNNISVTALGKFPSIHAAVETIEPVEPVELEEWEIAMDGLLWKGEPIKIN